MGDLFLGTVNFGPVKQAIARQTRAVGATVGLAQTGLQIFNLFEDTKFSEFLGDKSDLSAEYQSKVLAAVNSGAIRPDETGQILYEEPLLGDPSQGMIPSPAKSLREDYLESVQRLADKYPRNSKIQKYVESTSQEEANIVVLKAQQAVVEKYSRQREQDFADRLYPQAVQQSIAQGNEKPLRDLVIASDWIGTERQERMLEIGTSEIAQGTRRQGIRDLVRDEGLSAGSSDIQEMLSSGEITETQADELRKVAQNSATSAGLAWTDAARASFDGLMDEMTPEAAAREATETVPQPYRAQASSVLIAERNIAIQDADREADETFEDFYANNARNPSMILQQLYGAGRVGMSADTFRTWEARTQSLIRNAGDKAFASDRLALNELYLMSEDPGVSHDEVRRKVVEFLNADRLTDDDARLYTKESLRIKGDISQGYSGATSLLSGVIKTLITKANTAAEIEEIYSIEGQLGATLLQWFNSGKYSDEVGADGHSDLEKAISRELGKHYPRFAEGIREFFGGPLAPKPPELGQPRERVPEPVAPRSTTAIGDIFQSKFGAIRSRDTQGNIEAFLDENNVWHGSSDGGSTWYRWQDGAWVNE